MSKKFVRIWWVLYLIVWISHKMNIFIVLKYSKTLSVQNLRDQKSFWIMKILYNSKLKKK
jgi:hypothetical protein